MRRAAVLVASLLGLAASRATPGADAVRVVEPALAPDVVAYRRALVEVRPPLRGFRAPTLARASEKPPLGSDAPPGSPRAEAAAIVVRDLAREGLLTTLVRAVEALGADKITDASPLASVGLPVDLLAFFTWSGAERAQDADALARAVAERLAAGTPAAELEAELADATFAFRPSGFRAASESGERDAHTVRVQLTRGDTWLGDGDGGNVDLAREVALALPEARVIASVQERHAEELLDTLRGWDLADGRVTLVREPLVVAQWAQDNGKAGFAQGADAALEVATLAPRWASRGEGGSTFVPGETFLVDGLAAAGHRLVQSPLLFQGGNLLVAHDPARDERVALVGEAEVYRNVGLGLSEDQALDALRVELGVDRCVVLPAASFHVDAEVTLRSHAGELVAFVHDDRAAIAIVLAETIDAFERAGSLDAAQAEGARAALAAEDWATLVGALGKMLGENAIGLGVYPESFARHLETSEVDPGAANLFTMLLALDRVTALAFPLEQLTDRHAQAYLRSFEHTARDRAAIRATLEENGWRVVAVPSLPGGERGRNYLNALHDRARTLVPVYGGLFERLDRAALEAYEDVLGPDVRVVPIHAAESQRRGGAVHCSAALYTAP